MLLLLVSLWGFYWAINPLRITSEQTPATYGAAYRDVAFMTGDNIYLRGWYIPSSKIDRPTLILLHGYPADKGDLLSFAIYLHDEFNILMFDFRYFGQSSGDYTTAGKMEVNDLRAAISFLNQNGIFDIGVLGYSMGGAVALMTAASSPSVRAVAVVSSYAHLNWIAQEYYKIPLLRYPLAEITGLLSRFFIGVNIHHVSPVDYIADIKKPLLLIYSKNDSVVPYRHALAMQNAAKGQSNVEFILMDKATHGEVIVKVQQTIKQFFIKNLVKSENAKE